MNVEDYDRIWNEERANDYPIIDAFEEGIGFKVDRDRLQNAARVLACPYKVNPPNWQHGRLIYSIVRSLISRPDPASPVFRTLDIGTAKGFSAICAQWAINDSGVQGHVTSVDVIDPDARVIRNSVADLPAPRTLRETLKPWPESRAITFKQSTGTSWLSFNRRGLEFVFVDGKHNHSAVSEEVRLIRSCQYPGAVVLFDDAHVPGVRRAIEEMVEGFYEVRWITLKEQRAYAIATAVGG